MKPINRAAFRLMVLIPFLLAATVVIAEDYTESGKVKVQSTSISAGIGVEWGSGTLTLNDGSQHPFSMKGFKVVQVGIKKVSAAGTVYNLKDLSNFNGHYSAVEAGITLGGGVSGITMRNQNGVIINLGSTSTGVDLALGPQGMDIELK
jgi:hypothetical protein